ncbi:MAG: DUF255 domain-containing protein [Ferruginibacter sp.]
MQKVKAFLLVIVIAVAAFSFNTNGKEKINWITIEQLNEQYYKNPKPIVIDVYTNWCGWCKEMDRTTYKNDKLADYINQHYYAVKYNAESKDSVLFNRMMYKFNDHYQTNDLAMYFTFGKLEYPTTIFLSAIDARPAPLAGFLKPKEMEGPLKFFGEKADASQTFVEFNKKLKKEW